MDALQPNGRFTLAGFVVAALAAVALSALAYWFSERQAEAAEWVAHTHEVRTGIAKTSARLLAIEEAAHAYATTGQGGELQRFEASAAGLDADLETLRKLVSDNPGQLARLAVIEPVLRASVAGAREMVDARRAGEAGKAAALLESQTHRAAVQSLEQAMDAFDAEEGRLLQERSRDESAALALFRLIMALIVLAMLAALAALFVLVRKRNDQLEALHASEQRFEVLAHSVVDYAILLLDPEGRVASWNRGAERIKGYTADEVVGQHFSRFYPQEDIDLGKPARELEAAAREGHLEDEGWRIRKDGKRFWASVTITALRDSQGTLTGFGKVTRDLTGHKLAEELLRQANEGLESQVQARTSELRDSNVQLREAKSRLELLSARLISAQEEERKRISRELHDETGQALTGIRLRLKDAMGKIDYRERLEECVGIVDQAVAHIRNLAVNLRPPMLDDLGLADALEWALDQQAKAAGWRSTLEADSTPVIDPDVQTACFRIGQEALTNAARHAQASEVHVKLRVSPGRLELDVVDNGRGFNRGEFDSPAEQRKHFGLVSMTERAGLVGGSVEIDSVPGEGTRVRAIFPLAMAC